MSELPEIEPVQKLRALAQEIELALILGALMVHDKHYQVRYGLVLDAVRAARTLGYPAGFGWDPDNPDAVANRCRIVAYIELPPKAAGGPRRQLSWHMPEHEFPWDGHTTPQKWDRIAEFADGI